MHPVFLQVGSFTLRWYGVMLVVGVLASVWMGRRKARRVGIPLRQVQDYLLAMGVAGALGLVIRTTPLRWALSGFRVTAELEAWAHYGGTTMVSVLLLGLLGGEIYGWLARVRLAPLRDATAPGWLVAVSIWRVGCLLNGCCFGRETDSWAGVYLPDIFGHWAKRYPTQIAESLLCLAIVVVLLWQRRRKPFDGYIALLGTLLYFAVRFLLSFWRGDNYYLWPWLPEIQLYALVLVIVAGIMLVLRYRQRTHQAE